MRSAPVRPVLALLGGIAISITGLGIVLGTAWELVGLALIIGGVVVAAHGMSAATAAGLDGRSGVAGGRLAGRRSSIVGWPTGLGPRLARRGEARRKAD
jgi:hypothetical protein